MSELDAQTIETLEFLQRKVESVLGAIDSEYARLPGARKPLEIELILTQRAINIISDSSHELTRLRLVEAAARAVVESWGHSDERGWAHVSRWDLARLKEKLGEQNE